MGIENPEIGENGLVAACFGRLALQGSDLALHFLDDVLNAHEVRLGVFELAEGLLFLRLELCDAGSLLEDRAAVFWAVAQNLIDLALLHDRVGAAAHAGVHEELVDIAQAAGGFDNKILALTISIHTASDADFVPLGAELLFALGEGHGDLGHSKRRATIRAAENDIRHLSAPQGFGRLLAEHPADGVEDIGFATSIRADDGRDAPVEVEDGFCGEGFETDDFQRLQIHGIPFRSIESLKMPHACARKKSYILCTQA